MTTTTTRPAATSAHTTPPIVELTGPALAYLRERMAESFTLHTLRVAQEPDGRVMVKLNEGTWSYPLHTSETAREAMRRARQSCTACGAEAGETCRPSCIGEAAHRDQLDRYCTGTDDCRCGGCLR